MKYLRLILILLTPSLALNYNLTAGGGSFERISANVESNIEHFWLFSLNGTSYLNEKAFEGDGSLSYVAHNIKDNQLLLKAQISQIIARPEFLMNQTRVSKTLNYKRLIFENESTLSSIVTSSMSMTLTNHNRYFYLRDHFFYDVEFSYSRLHNRDSTMLFYELRPQFFIPLGHYNYLRVQLHHQSSFQNKISSNQWTNAFRIPFYRFRTFIEFGVSYETIHRNRNEWNINSINYQPSRKNQTQFFLQFAIWDRLAI